TAFVSQSGNLGAQLMGFAQQEDIGIRAFCGSGNEAMITIEDYMEFFADDELTKTLVMYIESIKDGKRFLDTATKIGFKKPVIALKGGRTAEGAEAAASHTGAMASNVKVFEAVCKQSGIVYAEHPMDLLDLSASFSSLPLPRDNRVAIMTFGGGWGVVAADLCAENGLQLPPLAPDIVARINKLLPPFWSHTNPIDLVGDSQSDVQLNVLSELMQWEGCDAVIHMGILGRAAMVEESLNSTLAVNQKLGEKLKESIMATANAVEDKFINQIINLMGQYHKPVIGVYWQANETTRTVIEVENQMYKGIAFPSPERAANALAKMNQYSHWLNNHQR
ncbi:MAG TPA: hypothetical protein VEH58_06365, partial [Dehalococcoidales bacterium]|nr:hypothetical protein [Dehalococcoidales bacterium]